MPWVEELAELWKAIVGFFTQFDSGIAMLQAAGAGIAEWFTNFWGSLTNMFN